MLDKIWEAATGKWGIIAVAVLALPGGRQALRSAGKEIIRAGIVVNDKVKEIVAEVREEASDVVAEVKAEREQTQKHDKKHEKATA
ncbi:MAG: hypothetical protein KGS72_08540 [Cyanobacteria bacterium REEB67]|nr:hypothetical protein [Cyanobacteria bacterium REEB67]